MCVCVSFIWFNFVKTRLFLLCSFHLFFFVIHKFGRPRFCFFLMSVGFSLRFVERLSSRFVFYFEFSLWMRKPFSKFGNFIHIVCIYIMYVCMCLYMYIYTYIFSGLRFYIKSLEEKIKYGRQLSKKDKREENTY